MNKVFLTADLFPPRARCGNYVERGSRIFKCLAGKLLKKSGNLGTLGTIFAGPEKGQEIIEKSAIYNGRLFYGSGGEVSHTAGNCGGGLFSRERKEASHGGRGWQNKTSYATGGKWKPNARRRKKRRRRKESTVILRLFSGGNCQSTGWERRENHLLPRPPCSIMWWQNRTFFVLLLKSRFVLPYTAGAPRPCSHFHGVTF